MSGNSNQQLGRQEIVNRSNDQRYFLSLMTDYAMQSIMGKMNQYYNSAANWLSYINPFAEYDDQFSEDLGSEDGSESLESVEPGSHANDTQEMNLDEITQEWLFGREQVENVEEAAESKSSLRKLGPVKPKTVLVDLEQIALADFFGMEEEPVNLDAPALENRLGNADMGSLGEEAIEPNLTVPNGDQDLHITGSSSGNDEDSSAVTLHQLAPSLHDYSNQQLGPVEYALLNEMRRLDAKKNNATGVEGFFWKSSYQAKSAAAVGAYTDLLAAYENQADKTVSREAFITQAIQDPTSSIYKALNTHSSYVFRFNASPLSFKARALLNIEKVIEDNKPPATEVSETVSFSAI